MGRLRATRAEMRSCDGRPAGASMAEAHGMSPEGLARGRGKENGPRGARRTLRTGDQTLRRAMDPEKRIVGATPPAVHAWQKTAKP